MMILLLAADDQDADRWVEWFIAMSPSVRTAVIDVDTTPITVLTPADDLSTRLDPTHECWSREGASPIKVLHTDACKFATEQRTVTALSMLGRRHKLVDPTGILGPEPAYLSARVGLGAATSHTPPIGAKVRPRKPVGVHRGVK
jgi:hypothetical protein